MLAVPKDSKIPQASNLPQTKVQYCNALERLELCQQRSELHHLLEG